MTFPPVLLGVSCGRRPASGRFFDAFYTAQLPEGSRRERAVSAHISKNMNHLFDLALNGDFEYLFYVDDDLLFDPDIVMAMLAHAEGMERVAPLVCQRHPPFAPYILEDGDEFKYRPLRPTDHGLIEVPAFVGAPGLIATSLLAKMPEPRFPENMTFKGNIVMNGDVLFTGKLKTLGVQTFVDLDCPMWHIGEYEVAWERGPEGWQSMVKLASDPL